MSQQDINILYRKVDKLRHQVCCLSQANGGGSGGDASTLQGQNGAYYLNYNNFTNAPSIPINNNQLTNGAGYLVSTNNLSDLTSVSNARTNLGLGTLATQNGTFSGASSGTNTGDETTSRINALYGYTPANGANYLALSGGTLTGTITAPSFVKSGGTSVQFLKADGSIDANTYLTTAVTSIGLTMPGVIFNTTVSGSPITNSGTLAPTLASQAAYTVLGNFTNASATPTWGKIDLANMVTGVLPSANGGSATATLVVSSASTLTLTYFSDVIFTGSTANYTAPAISSATGRGNSIIIKNRGTGTITLNGNLYSNTPVSTFPIAAGNSITLLPDGTYLNII